MSQEFDAIFTQGHLVPLEPVDLREGEKVRVRVQIAPAELETTRRADLTGMTLHDALIATGLLGIIEDAPPDLSTNPKYMEDFGKDDPPPS